MTEWNEHPGAPADQPGPPGEPPEPHCPAGAGARTMNE